jgi:hypothetical protein
MNGAGTIHRGRMMIALVITLLALPALWISQRSDTVGLAADGSVEVIIIGDPAPTTDVRDRPPTPSLLGQPGGAFLVPPEPLQPESVVPSTTPTTTTIPNVPSPDQVAALPDPNDVDPDTFDPENELLGSATFRSWLTQDDLCAARAIPADTIIKVVNLDNGQSMVCRVAFISLGTHDVILGRAAFARIADLTDAPIPVEITW